MTETNKTKATIVDEGFQFGLYFAYYKGRPIMDENMNFLTIGARKGDQTRIDKLIRAAIKLGLEPEHLEAKFEGGVRKITQEEWEHQLQRAQWGLTPDPDDIGAMIDGYNHGQR